MKCECCSFDFGETKEIRCPRCGAVQKCGMSCSGNCLKCHMTRNGKTAKSSIENEKKQGRLDK